MCLSVENAVRDSDSESAETERARAGAERHEENDGDDEGRLVHCIIHKL